MIEKNKLLEIKFGLIAMANMIDKALENSTIDPQTINQNKLNLVTGKKGGTISWRNNNSGNLKYIYRGAVGAKTKRSYEKALQKAKQNVGVLALDRYGYAVFDTKEHGDMARAKLLLKKHGERTIEEMLQSYAVDDYTGKADTKSYAKFLYSVAKKKNLKIKGKRIKNLTEEEIMALMEGMQRFEGYEEGERIA